MYVAMLFSAFVLAGAGYYLGQRGEGRWWLKAIAGTLIAAAFVVIANLAAGNNSLARALSILPAAFAAGYAVSAAARGAWNSIGRINKKEVTK